MRNWIFAIFLLPLHTFCTTCTDSQVFVITIHGLCEVSILPPTISMTIEQADDGEIEPAVADGVYNIVNNFGSDAMILAEIDEVMIEGTKLELTISAPSGGGTGSSNRTLSTTPQAVVTNIPLLQASGVAFDLSFSIVTSASVPPPASISIVRVMTFTLTDN